MATTTDPFRQIFLAGVGALALGAEKSQEVIETLVKKGQITVEQGKEIAADLQTNATEKTEQIRDDIIRAQMSTMTKEQRDEFATRIAEIAASVDVNEAAQSDESAKNAPSKK